MKHRKTHFHTTAFTLIELLIVVAIIGILAAIAVPNFLNAQLRAKLAKTYANMKTIQSAISAYNLDYNWAPVDQGPDATDGRTYLALTTPVAYLSDIDVFKDPFYTKMEEDAGVYFAYGAPLKFDQLEDSARITPYKKANISYFIFCWGPDREPNWPWPDLDAGLYSLDKPHQAGPNRDGGIFYSPTNGIRSSGDLLSTSSRIYR